MTLPAIDLLSNPLVQRVGWALVHFLWQGAALAAALAVCLAVLRNRSAQVRWLLACAALGLMAACPPATAWLVAVEPAAVPPAAMSPPGAAAAAPELIPPAGPERLGPIAAGLPLGRDATAASSRPVLLPTVDEAPAAGSVEVSAGAAVAGDAPPPIPWHLAARRAMTPALPWLFVAWLLGVAAMLVWHVGGWLHLERVRRVGVQPVGQRIEEAFERLARRLRVSRPVRLVESALVSVPMVVGWLRPVVLLPACALAGLTPGELEAVLAHELAHVRRCDCLVRLLQAVVETLLFYHPAVWWVSRRIREESEHCCDEAAVGACGNRRGYARALARVAELGRRRPHLAAAADGGRLLPRIRRVLGVSPAGTDTMRSRVTAWLVLGVLVTGAGLLCVRASGGDEPGGETAAVEAPVPEVVEVDSLTALRKLAPVTIGERWQVRVALADAGAEAGPWKLLYCLATWVGEGEPSLDFKGEEPGAVLGPVFYRLAGEGLEPERSRAALASSAPREGLYCAVVPVAYKGRRELRVMASDTRLLMQRTLRVEEPAVCYWQELAVMRDHLVEDQPAFLVTCGKTFAALPMFDSQTPVWRIDGDRKVLSLGPERGLPGRVPMDLSFDLGAHAPQEELREGDVPAPLRLALRDDVLVINSPVEMLNWPDLHLLARWWVNNRPIVPQRSGGLRAIHLGRAIHYQDGMQLGFGLPACLGPLKVGDKVRLQVLYSPGGIIQLPSKDLGLDLVQRLATPRRDAAVVPLLSNPLEFVVTEAMLAQRAEAQADEPTADAVADEGGDEKPTVSFRVLRPDGTPLAGGKVLMRLYTRAGPDERPSTTGRKTLTTDADGRVAWPIETFGRWQMNVLAPGVGYVQTEEFDVPEGPEPPQVDLDLQPAPCSISGRATDAHSGKPVEGVSISCWESRRKYPGLPFEGATSDADGRWTLSTLPPGEWRMQIEMQGYRRKFVTATVNEERPAADLAVTLDPGAIVRGRVLKPDGTPLADTEVRVFLASYERNDESVSVHGTYKLTTDADGVFTPDAVEFGRWGLRVVVHGVGYAIVGPRDFRLGEQPEPITAQLRAGVRISGRVTNTDTGQPVEGALVTYNCRDYRNKQVPLEYVRTAADGTWSQSDLPPDAYQVGTQKGGYSRAGSGANAEVVVRQGEDVADIQLTLEPEAEVRGVVLGADGKTPLAGATVEYQGQARKVTADAEGRFSLTVSPRGAQTLTVEAPGYTRHSHVVAIPADKKVPEQQIVLSARGATLSGIVTNRESGKPMKDQTVMAVSARGGEHSLPGMWLDGDSFYQQRPEDFENYGEFKPTYRTTTGEDGRYRLENVAPGTYRVCLFPDYGKNVRTDRLTVSEGKDVEGIDLEATIRPKGFVTGRVFMPDGQPLASARGRLAVQSPGTNSGSIFSTDGTGRYYARMGKAGAHRVLIALDGYKLVDWQMELDPEAEVAGDVDFRLVAERHDASLSGRVLMPDGTTPAAGVLVTPLVTSGYYPGVTASAGVGEGVRYSFFGELGVRTGEDGSYRIEGLRPGKYGVHATPHKELSWGEAARPELRQCLPAMSDEMDVAESAQVTMADVTLGEGGSVVGLVLDARTGKPIAGARVRPHEDYQPGRGFRPFRNWRKQQRLPFSHFLPDVKTDDRGVFRIDGLRPAAYRLETQAQGYEYSWRDFMVEIQAGRSEEINIELKPQEDAKPPAQDDRAKPITAVPEGSNKTVAASAASTAAVSAGTP